jgi:hypothetical protein
VLIVVHALNERRGGKKHCMTSVLTRPIRVSKAHELVESLRGDPEIMEAVERGMEARLEGRVKPWSRVKKELGI